jgi:putative tricarboxylic transport membrane protein
MIPTRDDVRRIRVGRCCAAPASALLRHAAGHRRHHRVLHVLCGREAKISKDARALRQGRDRGRGAPESANNAAAQTAFIPTLTLGIPGDA